MLIKLLISMNVSKIRLAGFDGYNETDNNFFKKEFELNNNHKDYAQKNRAVSERITELRKQIEIIVLTKTNYDI